MPALLPTLGPVAGFRQPSTRYLASAVALSLLLHALVLVLPAGRMAAEKSGTVRRLHDVTGAPAALNVRLSPWSFRAAVVKTADVRLQADVPPASASAVNQTPTATEPGNARTNPGIPAPVYFAPSEVTRGPQPLADIDPDPEILRGQPGSGTLVMTLFINESGRLDRVAVETLTLNRILERAIVQEFEAVHFRPAEIDGVPVKSRMRIEVRVAPLLAP